MFSLAEVGADEGVAFQLPYCSFHYFTNCLRVFVGSGKNVVCSGKKVWEELDTWLAGKHAVRLFPSKW